METIKQGKTQAREFRIGNFVGLNLEEFPENYFTMVEVADHTCVVTDGLQWHPLRDRQYFEAEDFEGIPLTEEWLTQLGFHKKENPGFKNISLHYWAKDAVLLFFNDSPPYNTYLVGFGFTYLGEYYAATTKWIDKVHELQNCFFAIKDKELQLDNSQEK